MSDKNIRSKNNLTTQNIIRLLKLFIEKDSLSISDIEKELGFKTRQTIYSYINSLQHMGCVFSKNIHNRHTYYSLEHKDSKEVQLLLYEPLTLKTLRKYSILKKLQNKPVSEKNSLQTTIPDIKKSQFYELFNELLAEKEIYKSEEDNLFYLTGKTFMPTIQVSFDQLESLYYQLPALPSTTSHAPQYQSLYKKIAAYFDEPDSDSHIDNYICYGYFPHALNEQTLYIFNQLQSAGFSQNILKITYTSRKNLHYTKTFAVGLIVHVLEKDKLYLVGKDIQNLKKNTVIPIENISHIEKTQTKNNYYLSKEFEDLFDSMFSISTDSPVKVTLSFDDWGNIKDKTSALCKQRPNASQQYDNQQIIYTDSISGLNDFANYLRQFGKAVHVLEPAELHDKLQESAKKTLDYYKRSTHE